MKKLVSLLISLALVAFAQGYSFERKFVVDALLLYAAGAVVFVFGFLKREPLAPLLSAASEEAPSSLLWRPTAGRRRLLIGLAVTAVGVALSAVAAYQFLQVLYPWPWMAAWAAGIVVALAGCFMLSPRGESTGEPPVNTLWETGLLVVILLVALAMRLYQIDVFPAGVYLDEADNALLGLQTVSAPAYSPFTRLANGHPTLFLYFLGYALKVFGSTAFVLRFATVFIGMVTVAAFYPLAKLMFGYRIGLALTFLLAVSRWHVNFSRISFDGIAVPLFVILTFYFLLKGMQTKRIWDFAWAGIAVAAG